MNVLMIGGTGVLSTAVTNEALKQGIHVVMINRGHRKELIPDGVELIKSDKNDFNRICSLLGERKFDAVIDFLCYNDKETTESFNFYSHYTKQYFFISSCAVYNTELATVCNENSPKVRSMWGYSVNKWASEELLMKLAANSNCNYTVIRPCVTYDDTRIPYGISPQYGYHWTLVARILSGKPIIRWNGGINRCNMMRVEDFAVGVIGLIGKDEAYNSNDKIKAVVPLFRHTISLRKGIEMTYNAYRDNHYQFGIDWEFEGDTDRIILKWCKKNRINTDGLNLHFIDYLGDADSSDKRKYIFALHRGCWDVWVMMFGFRVVKKVKRILLGK